MGRGPSSGNTGSAGRVEKAIGEVPLWHEGYRPRLNSRDSFPFFAIIRIQCAAQPEGNACGAQFKSANGRGLNLCFPGLMLPYVSRPSRT